MRLALAHNEFHTPERIIETGRVADLRQEIPGRDRRVAFVRARCQLRVLNCQWARCAAEKETKSAEATVLLKARQRVDGR